MMDEIYRVLKPYGTAWINLGDTYGTQSGGLKGKSTFDPKNKNATIQVIEQSKTIHKQPIVKRPIFSIIKLEINASLLLARSNPIPFWKLF
jgi:hypothetical protein